MNAKTYQHHLPDGYIRAVAGLVSGRRDEPWLHDAIRTAVGDRLLRDANPVTSLDAAEATIPDGWFVATGPIIGPDGQIVGVRAVAYRFATDPTEGPLVRDAFSVDASSKPRAVTSAALMIRAGVRA